MELSPKPNMANLKGRSSIAFQRPGPLAPPHDGTLWREDEDADISSRLVHFAG
jgi:hypothetical protein